MFSFQAPWVALTVALVLGLCLAAAPHLPEASAAEVDPAIGPTTEGEGAAGVGPSASASALGLPAFGAGCGCPYGTWHAKDCAPGCYSSQGICESVHGAGSCEQFGDR